MFDLEFSYHTNPPFKHSKSSEYGEEESYLYKVKTTKKKPYFIRVDKFLGELHFIKFYPKNYKDSPLKYKIRIGKINELSRLIGTCIKIAKQIYDDNNDASFAFHGQWDEKDLIINVDDTKVENYKSQRYKIYQKAIFRKINSSKFKFIYENKINVMLIVPNHVFENVNQMAKIKQNLYQKYGNNLSDFMVPTVDEYKTYKQ